MSSHDLLDPSPQEWFNDDKKFMLYSQLSSCVPLLKESSLLNQVVNYFILRQCSLKDSEKSGYLDWARKTWGHQLDQLYLENKTKLDQISYRLMRTSDQGLAFELYHRLIANEESFDVISMKYGEGNERFNGGMFKLQNFEDIPAGIDKLLRNLEVGQCSKPISIKGKFGILQVVEFLPAVRGEEVERRLLERQFQFWIKGMTIYLSDQLRLECQVQS